MRQNALKMVLITAVMGVFGAFFRWLENLNAFETDTGLMLPFAKTTVLMAAYIIAAAVLFAVLAAMWTKRCACGTEPSEALRPLTFAPNLLCRLCGAAMVVLGVALMFYAPGQRYPTLERLLAAACIFGGTAIMFIMVKTDGTSFGGRGASLVPVLFACMWLVCSYKNNAEDPVTWAFLPEILAIIVIVMAWYELAAYHYGRAKPASALFFVQAAAFMSITTLSDERSGIMTALFAMHAAMMLMFEFLLVENYSPRRHEKTSRPAAE